MELVKGKHYNLNIRGTLIEVRHMDSDPGNCTATFQDVTTQEQYVMSLKDIIQNITEIPVAPGTKWDAGKLRYDLMVWDLVEGITAVLTHGAKKYSPGNWMKVKGRRWRYFGALMRHMLAWWKGEKLDPETQLSHLFHAGCCLAFLAWCDNNPSPDDMAE